MGFFRQRQAAGALILAAVLALPTASGAQRDGFLHRDGQTLFPIGSYELPETDAELRAMAAAGTNLVRCHSREDLDRAHAAGLRGWVPLGITAGATDELRARVESLADHPALAVWEGPDEIVWNFTAFSGLAKTAGFTREEWWGQRPTAVAYAREQAADLMPKINAAIDLVREVDSRGLPFWINEAGSSDVIYARQYMDAIDITGCDYYSVRPTKTDLERVGGMTDRWRLAGRGKPVWMVLQAFSWHTAKPDKYLEPAYPTYDESRFMAWDAIVHGAQGVLYWGSFLIDTPGFRESIYALTAELAALQPLLVCPELAGVSVNLIEAPTDNRSQRGVRVSVRTDGQDWIVVLVNEDEHRHLATEVTGLGALDERQLELLYGDERVRVDRGALLTRLQAYETKIFATSRRWETSRTEGRDFGVDQD